MRTLPPIRALQAFEAAARHGSVTAAAEELHVTASAISHQLKALERYLGVHLFHRLNRRIALTDIGRSYLQLLATVFDRIEGATEHVIHGGVSDVLTVHCPPTFAPSWLLPRLPDFRARHPDIDVRLHATPEPPDFFRSDTDVEIRYGTGDWPGLTVITLMGDAVMPVAAPAIAKSMPAPATPQAVLDLPLIHSERAMVGWADWARRFGLRAATRRGLRFDRGYLSLQAAALGLGVALETRVFAEPYLRSGALVPLLGERGRVTAGGHFLVYPAVYADMPKVLRFRDWILDMAAGQDTDMSATISGAPA